jgi:hypothetical protein
MNETHESTFLFATPSFAEGMGRLFDFANVLNAYNTSVSEAAADNLAARMDWQAVGNDIAHGITDVAVG